jgi:hypothetical protein
MVFAMIEIKPAHAEKACLAHSCFGLSKQEIQFALKSPGLNQTHKLVWIVLAALNANDPDYAKQMSLHQFARMLNIRDCKLWRVIQELEAMGFIHLFKQEEKKHSLIDFFKKGRDAFKKRTCFLMMR